MPGKPFPREDIVVGMIHPNELYAASFYDYAHYTGSLEMQKNIGLRDDQIIRKVNVFEGKSDEARAAITDCIEQGANVILAVSWGYMDVCEKLAKEYPHVVFAHSFGYKSNKTNFTNYAARLYQARYLSGIVAGYATKTNKIGFVAALGRENSEVTRGVDAFAIGVARVNPHATVYVRVTQSWYDPLGETDAANSLLDAGCDIIAEHCNTAYPLIAAAKAQVKGIGFCIDMRADLPDTVITSVVVDWGVYYTALIQSIIDGSFTTEPYFGGLKENVVSIAPFEIGSLSADEQALLAGEQERIKSGQADVFDGLLRTNEGTTVGSEGATLPESEIISNIHWYYENVKELEK